MSKQLNKTTLSYWLMQKALTGFKVVLFLVALTGVFLYTRAGAPERATALTPMTLNFQARLLTGSGAIVADGKYNVEFKLYDAASGGNLVWTETRFDTNGGAAGNDFRVDVKSGYLSVYLGDVTAFGSINWDQQLYLTMNIGGTSQTTPSWDGEMNPRLRLTSVPYAVQAQRAEQLARQVSGFSAQLLFPGTLGQNTVYNLVDPGASYPSVDICLTSGNCAGSGAGVTVSAPGTSGYLSRFTAGQQIANSVLFQDDVADALEVDSGYDFSLLGGDLSVTGNVSVTGNSTFTGYIDIPASTAPGLSASDVGRMYFDAADNVIKLSQNGGAFYDICTTGGNCAGSGSGVTASGTTAGYIPVLTGTQQLGNSVIFQDTPNTELEVANGYDFVVTGGDLLVTGGGSFSSNVTFGGGITVNNNSSISQTGTGTFSTGTGNVSLNGATSVTGSNTFTVGSGATALGGTLNVTGATTLQSTLAVQGASITVGGASQPGSLIINDGSGGQTATISSANLTQNTAFSLPNVNFATAEFCVRYNSGSSNCSGLGNAVDSLNGLQGALNIVGTTNEIEISTATPNITIGLPNDVTIGDDLTVTDALSSASLSVSGNATVGGTLGVTGASTFTGLATFNGGVTVANNSSFSQTGSGTFSTGTGAVTLNGATSVSGANTFTVGTGLTTLGGGLTATGTTNINATGTAATVIGNTSATLSLNGSSIVLGTAAVTRTAAGTTNIDLIDASNTTLSITNSGAGNANLTVDGNGTFGNGLTVTTGGITVTGNSSITGTLTGLTGLTSSGTITFSGLTTDGVVTVTSGVLGSTTTLSVSNGGTGAASLTANGVLFGNGTSAVQATGAAANSVLVTDGSNVPSLSQTLPAAVQGNITSTGALDAGSITANFGAIDVGADNISTTGTISAGTLSVSGNATVGGALAVTGASTFTGLATFDGGLSVTAGEQFTNAGSTLFTAINITDKPTGGAIGAANATVDISTTFNVDQDTTGQTLTLPTPTDTTAGRIIYINNVGSANFSMGGVLISAGRSQGFIWTGTAWTGAGIDSAGDGVTQMGTIDSQTKSANGAVISNNTLYLQTADGSFPGLVSTGAQTFAGSKTFSAQIVANGGINLGTQTLQGTTAVIDFSNFDVDASGNVDVGGTLSAGTGNAFQVAANGAVTAVGVNAGTGLLQGTGGLTLTGTASINTTGTANTSIGNATGQLTVTGSSASTFVIDGSTISAAEFVLLDGRDAALVDINDTVNTAITGVGTLTSGSIASGFGTISTANNITTSATLSGGTLTVTNNATIGGDLTVSGGSGTFGADGQAGTIVLYDGQSGASAHTLTLTIAGTLGQNSTVTLPDPGAGGATVCYQNSASCGFALASGNNYVFFTPSSAQNDTAAEASIYINDTGGGNLLQLQSGGSDQFVIANNGDTSVNGNVSITGNLTASGTVTFSGLTADRLVATTTGGQLTNTITAANLAASVTGTTGTGNLVFSASPTFTGTVSVAALNASGNVDIDGSLTVGSAGQLVVDTSGNLDTTGNVEGAVVNATTGFRVNGGATTGNYLRGDGTNFISSALMASDLSGTIFNSAADTGTGTYVTGDTISVQGGTNGIDTSLSGDTFTINLDTTEIGTTTFGSGSGFTWTFNAGATDPSIAFASDALTVTAGTSTFTGDLAVTGDGSFSGNLTVGTNALFVDATNNRIGIGTLTPDFELHVVGADGQSAATTIETYGGIPVFGTARANGTAASPTALLINDNFAQFSGEGYGSTGFSGTQAAMTFSAAENWTDIAQGTNINFYNTPAGSTTLTRQLFLQSNGNLKLGTTGNAASPFGGRVLEIESADNHAVLNLDSGPSNAAMIVLSKSGTARWHIENDANNFFTLTHTGVAQRFTINTDGNIGIGTYNASARLQVVGAATGSATTAQFNNSTSTGNILVAQDNGTAVFTIADGGNITATGTAIFTNAVTDITTGTNQDLTVVANGTGVINLDDTVRIGTLGSADTDAVVCRNAAGQLASCNSTFATTTQLGSYVQFAPNSAQSDTSANASIYINDTGGGNLIQLQVGASDRFVVSNAGDVTAAGDLAVNGGDLTSTTSLNVTASNGALTLVSTGATNDIILNSGRNIELQDNTNITGSLNVSNGLSVTAGGASIAGNSTIATTAGNTLSLGNTTGALTVTGSSASTFVINGVTITASEFNLLDGKDAALVDVNDAVNTAVTGTGALNSGSITSGFGSIDTGADNIQTTGTVQGGIVNATTGFRVNGAAAAGNYLRGDGANFISSALMASDLSGTIFSTSADTNAGTNTVVSGDTLSIQGGTNGIDTSLNNDTYTINLDTTEIGTTTFGAGSGFTWTFDASAGTDTSIAFANNALTVTSANTTLTGDLAVNGGDLTSTTALNVTASNGALTLTSTGAGNDVIINSADTIELQDNTNVTGSLNVSNGLTVSAGGASIAGNTTVATTAGNTLSIGNATGQLTVTGSSASTFVINGVTITAAEFNLLDGKDAALVDVNDAVNTAITGTGALNAGSITSGFGAIDTGADNIQTTGTVQGGIVNATTGFRVNGAAATGEYLRGNGTNFVSSALMASDLSGTIFSTSADTNAGTNTVVSGDTLSIQGGTNGIDTSLNNDTYTINLDTTEIGTTTFGAGSGFTWTFDAGATDPTIAFASNALTVTAANTTLSGDLAVNGGDLTSTAALSVTASNGALTLTSTGATADVIVNAGRNIELQDNTNISGSLGVSNGLSVTAGGASIAGNTTIATTAGNTLGLGNATGTLTVTGSSASTFVLNGVTITAAEFNLLDGKDAALVDVNDAVNTAVTGTGALNSGSITSGFGAIDTGADNIQTTGTVQGGIINATTGFRINGSAAAGNYLRGDGTNFVSAALAASDLSGTIFSTSGDTGTGTLTTGETISIQGGTNGIDTSLSGDTFTLNLDTSEIGTTTFGSGSGFTWTFNTGGTSPTIAFANNALTVTSATTTLSGDLAVNGGDITSTGVLTINSSSYVRIGDSGTPGVATGDDDLYVEGDLEVDANTNLAGTLSITGVSTISTTDAGALVIRNSGATETVFSADTNARSGTGGNLIKIGNSTGTDTATTILQLDSASVDLTSNLSALNGGLYYNNGNGTPANARFMGIINGATDEICLRSLANCTGGSGAIGGSGTANQLAFFSPNGATIASDADFTFDGSTIGTTATLNFNTSGSAAINLGTATYSGTISIGNASSTTNIVGTVNINNSGAGTTNIAASGTGAVNIGNATGALSTQGSTVAITSNGAGNDITVTSADQIILNSGGTIELQDSTNITGSLAISVNADVAGTLYVGTSDAFQVDANGNLVTSGDAAINGGDITSTGALNITPGGALTLGVTGQTALLQGSVTTITSNGAGNDIALTSADQIILNAAGTIELQDNTNVTGSFTVSGNSDVAGYLYVGSADQFQVDASGNTQTSGTLQVGGLTALNGGFTSTRTLNVDSGTTQNIGSINFATPADTTGTNTSNGLNITPTIGDATGGTNTANIINIANTTGDAQVSLNALNIGTLTGTAANEYALNIGSGWDSVLRVNGTEVINGSGQVISTALSGTLFSIDSDTNNPSAVSQSNIVQILGGSNGIDTSHSGNDITLNLDYTEISAATFGTGSGFTWTYDVGAVDPQIGFASDQITLTVGSTVLTGDLAVNGGDITSTGALNITPGGALTVGVATQTATLQGTVTTITSNGAGNDIILNSADTIELQDNTNITGNLDVSGSITGGSANQFTVDASGNLTTSGDAAVNGGDITSTGALNITPGGALTVGATTQTAVLQGSSVSVTSTGAGNDITLLSADQVILNAGTTIELQDSTNISGNLDISGTLTVGTADQFQVSSGGALTFVGVATDITTGANEDLTVVANGTGTIVLNDTVTANGTLTFSGVTTDITTGANEDLTVVANGTGVINLNDSITAGGDITFANGASRTLGVQTQAAGVAGNNLTVSAGGAGSGGAAAAGGILNLQGGAAAGTGNANGGNIVLSGGAGVGTGARGLVVVDTATFSAATVQNFTGNGTITQANVDSFGTILISSNAAGYTATLGDPTNTTTGRIIYVTNTGSFDMTLSVNGGGTGNTISLKPSTTATMVWNGTDWTAAGASSSTDLQAAYNNTATSAGGAELILNAPGGSADGFTIRNNGVTPINGGLLEVQSSIGTNLFSVNSLATEWAANGGAETSSSFSTNWTSIGTAASPTRTTTAGQYVTGQAGVSSVFGTAAGNGVRNNLSTNPTPGDTLQISFTAKLGAGSAISDLRVDYTPTGASTGTMCTQNQTLSSSEWTKITCEVVTPGTAVTNPDILIYQVGAAGVARTIYIDNLSVTRANVADVPSNVQIGGGINGGQVTLFTLDRSSTPPVENGNTTYLGSMYYDTTTGRIQCYEADGWGACGSAPDNIIVLTPEYAGAVLNGSGVGTMTADFCANQPGTLVVPTTGNLCASGLSRQFYKWNSPQATLQTYSIYVSHKLPNTFKEFASDNTITLTGLSDNVTNGQITYEVFRSTGSAITACGTETDVVATTDTANTWYTRTINGNEQTGCSFAAGDNVVFKINVKARSNANVYVENLNFTYTNR